MLFRNNGTKLLLQRGRQYNNINSSARLCQRSFSSPSLSTLAAYSEDVHHSCNADLYFSEHGNRKSTNSRKSAFETAATTTTTQLIQDNNAIINDDNDDLLTHYSSLTPTPASLAWLLQTGSRSSTTCTHHHDTNDALLTMAEFLRQELPIRLAHRIVDLDHSGGLRRYVQSSVRDVYRHSLHHLVHEFPTPIATRAAEQRFAQVLTELYQNHAGVLVDMARGAYQWREELRQERRAERRRAGRFGDGHSEKDQDGSAFFAHLQECHQFLDRFYLSRIGIRFLAGQYLALRQPPPQESYIGMICKATRPIVCVRQAIADASFLCRRTFGRCPRVDIVTAGGDDHMSFPYIPTYLHYILLELLKNALRATMEAHEHSAVVPPVQVIIADGDANEDVVIKVADEGGGIARSQVDKIWSYLYTTASPKVQQSFIGSTQVVDHSRASPLAGLGYGLPISRGYSRYFGGDLDIQSLEGYGTDAFVHLKRLGDFCEPVPQV